MQFELEEDQAQLSESLARLLGDRYPFERRSEVARGNEGWSRDVWQSLSELGLPSILVPEAHGGIGGRMSDLWAPLGHFGKALLLEPAIQTLVLGPVALSIGASREAGARLLPEIAAGTLRVGVAQTQFGCGLAGHTQPGCGVKAISREQGWVLTGSIEHVLHGPTLDRLIVLASAAAAGREETLMFLVDPAAPDVKREDYRLLDDSIAATLVLDGSRAELLGPVDRLVSGPQPGNPVSRCAVAASSADMLGAMEAAFQATVDYVRVRRQFGRPLAENQAVRHTVADMSVAVELVRSLSIAAIAAIDHPDDEDSAADIARAATLVPSCARKVCESAIQLHGAVGVTEELAVGHYLRRVLVQEQFLCGLAAGPKFTGNPEADDREESGMTDKCRKD